MKSFDLMWGDHTTEPSHFSPRNRTSLPQKRYDLDRIYGEERRHYTENKIIQSFMVVTAWRKMMDPLIAVLVFMALIVIRFMIPATVIFTFAKVIDRYFPAE